MSDERGLLRAEDFQRQQDELAVARIRAQLEKPGDDPFCKDCGEEIELARLAALPSATRCRDCQVVIESRSRR